jgi:hypothetical protein
MPCNDSLPLGAYSQFYWLLFCAGQIGKAPFAAFDAVVINESELERDSAIDFVFADADFQPDIFIPYFEGRLAPRLSGQLHEWECS